MVKDHLIVQWMERRYKTRGDQNNSVITSSYIHATTHVSIKVIKENQTFYQIALKESQIYKHMSGEVGMESNE